MIHLKRAFLLVLVLLLAFASPLEQKVETSLIENQAKSNKTKKSTPVNPNKDEQISASIEPTGFYLWLNIVAVLFLLLIAGLMSGLTIGLISLDMNNLTILKVSGTALQQRYASTVEPIRRNGHLLLCTLLILNMLATETLPIVLDHLLGGGLIAIVISTILIVLFGEIIPQAICARHALAIGAHSAWLVRILMVITYPISWPISKLLCWLIGEQEGTVYRRAELKELVALHGPKNFGELTSDEVTIIASVLDLKNKQVEQIMTPLDDVFMLDLDTVLDAAAFRLIHAAGYSRIPVFVNGDRSSIIGVILVKSLITLEHSKKYKIRDIKDYLMSPVQYFDAKTNLFNILNEFQEGKGHLAVIADNLLNNKGKLKIVGILTLEDVVEEVIGEEIIDETDLYVDMKTKKQVKRSRNQIILPNDHFTKRHVRRSKRGLIRRPVTFESHYGHDTRHRWSGLSTWTSSSSKLVDNLEKSSITVNPESDEDDEEEDSDTPMIPKV